MTPQRIADISEPIEQLYSDLTDELLINIAKHLSRSTATWSALHEIETLEEMGQLTQENIEIINTYVAKMPQEIKDAMNESRLEALGEIEQKLKEAAEKGYLTTPVSDSTVDVVQALSNQAAEQLNLVNQTMLNTSLQQYQNGIYEFRREMENAAPKTIENEQQLELAQHEIDIAAGKTVTGTETRYNAMRKAIRSLNNAGIVGYYDRANRAWTAEAYVNMDIRTTVHNTYIQSVQTRQQDYGSDVFQVSAHAGARPLCYPYQGKLYSWSSSGGYIRLGDGKQHRFEPIGTTSYGEPAGLFGINCGHVPYPMIPNVSEPVKEDIQTEEENTKQYQESQKQRALERQIRYAKRNVEMLGNLATDADRDRIKQAQANMRAFIQETGRTRRYDREQIVTQRGTTGTKPTARTPITPNITPVSAKTIDKIVISDELSKSLKNAGTKEYTEILEKAPDRIKALYNNLADKLRSVHKKKGNGYYTPSEKSITWSERNYDGTSKWTTLAHEYGHFADDMSVDNYSHNEADRVNALLDKYKIDILKPLRNNLSNSDKFLAAVRADKELNRVFEDSKEKQKEITTDLLKNRNGTAGLQDCFDGWFHTRELTGDGFLPWGHGDKYYNRFYKRNVKDSGKLTELKEIYNDLGLKAENKHDVAQICRDYETASELWANITGDMTCNENVLKYYEKYTPNSLQAYIEITEGLINATD